MYRIHRNVFIYDYFEGVSSSNYQVTLGEVWEFTIRALGIADKYTDTNEEGTSTQLIILQQGIRLISGVKNNTSSF